MTSDVESVMKEGGRRRELQDPLNRMLYHPAAKRLAAQLARTRITPNMVSVAGGLIVVAAAAAYAMPYWPLSALLGLALHMSWHILDGADGDLARMTGKAGPLGEIVDGISDYASHIVLYCVLALVLRQQIGDVAWLLAIAAGGSRAVQANHYEVQRRQYQQWRYDRPWLRNQPVSEHGAMGQGLGALANSYLKLADRLSGSDGHLDQIQRKARNDPAALERFRQAVGASYRPLMRPSNLLGANLRTLGLGFSMMAGTPIYFFAYEAILLNGVLLWSIYAHRRAALQVSRACA